VRVKIKAPAALSRGTKAEPERTSWVGPRLALALFAAVEIAMLVTVLVVGRHQWFFFDEWDFLVTRRAGSINDLLRPHYGHWSALPILTYRALFNVFGLRTYLPYQIVVVGLHLIVAALLRLIMRRAGVGPWLATTAASLFALLGSGYEDIIWAFQIGFVGSLTFGLVQLLLADHDGPVDRRDWLGLLAGIAGLLCSGVAVVMTVAVGVTTLVRRGWRIALLHTGPIGALYVIWWFSYGSRYYSPGAKPALAHHIYLTLLWVKGQLVADFGSIGHLPGVGAVLAAVLVVGLALVLRRHDLRELRTRVAAPGALLAAGLLFIVVTGWERSFQWPYVNNPGGAQSRYVHIFAAMAMPALALAAQEIVARWQILLPLILAALVTGVPGNLEALSPAWPSPYAAVFQSAYRREMLVLVSLSAVRRLPPSYKPDPFFAPEVTIGWLLEQKAAGRLPAPGPVSPAERANLLRHLPLPRRPPGRHALTAHVRTRTSRATLRLRSALDRGTQSRLLRSARTGGQ
jgi:hypothetical protein